VSGLDHKPTGIYTALGKYENLQIWQEADGVMLARRTTARTGSRCRMAGSST